MIDKSAPDAGGRPLIIMLDTMIYDRIVALAGCRDRLQGAIDDGRVDIIKTHIQIDQLAKIADPEKRAAVLSVPGRLVSTSGAIWNISRFGQSTFGSGAGDVKIADVQKGNARHAADALIATTAAAGADILVTEDKRLRSRVRETGTRLKVLEFRGAPGLPRSSLLIRPAQPCKSCVGHYLAANAR